MRNDSLHPDLFIYLLDAAFQSKQLYQFLLKLSCGWIFLSIEAALIEMIVQVSETQNSIIRNFIFFC